MCSARARARRDAGAGGAVLVVSSGADAEIARTVRAATGPEKCDCGLDVRRQRGIRGGCCQATLDRPGGALLHSTLSSCCRAFGRRAFNGQLVELSAAGCAKVQSEKAAGAWASHRARKVIERLQRGL